MRFWPVALGCVLIVGCGKADEGHTMRVTNWGGAGDDGPMAQLVLRKNKEFEVQTQTRVKIEGIPSEYVPKMLLNFAAGTQPDVMVVDASSAAVFVKNDMLQDLRPFFAKDPDFRINDYFQNVLKTFASDDGAIYAIPNDFTPMVLYYNRDLFDRAGVSYPTEAWTFADFRAAALKLTKRDASGKATQYGFSFTNWMPGWCMWIWNNDGNILNPEETHAGGIFDSKQNVETFTFLRDLINRDGVAPSLSQAASMGVDPFVNGNAAMTISGHWSLTDYKNAKQIDWKRLGVASVPHQTPRSNTVLYLSGYGIPKGAKNPDLAWKYVKYWTSAAVQREYQTSGIAVCARRDVAGERAGKYVEQLDPSQKLESMFLPIIPTGRPPAGASVPGYDVVEKIGTSAMQSILNGADVQQTLSDAANRIDREFAKSK